MTHRTRATVTRRNEILAECGWQPPSEAVFQAIVDGIQKRGFFVHAAARNFFENFGGFSARFQSQVHGGWEWFDFDVLYNGFFDAEDVKDYGLALGRDLCPIGQARRSHLTLAMDQLGVVYGYYSPYIIKLGSDFDEAIDNLCNEVVGLPSKVYDGGLIEFA